LKFTKNSGKSSKVKKQSLKAEENRLTNFWFTEIVGVPTCVDKELSSRVGEWTESNGANGDEYNLAIWATQKLARYETW
jgi:hypothetical protein